MNNTKQTMNKQILMDYGLKLEHIVSREDIDCSSKVIEILKFLQSLEIDPYLIQKARIIISVNNLRKCITNEEVISLSKSLLRSWKKRVVEENGLLKEYLVKNSILNERKIIPNQTNESQSEYEKILSEGTTNANRLKCRDLLAKALVSEKENKEDLLSAAKLSSKIEKYIYKEFNNTDTKYKNRVRSRVLNLNNERNSELKRNVLSGFISVQKFAIMTTEEMASDLMKDMRKQYELEGLIGKQLPEIYGTTTDLLKCPKCKKNTCAYNQAQIERADEPMTTFCLCIDCGNRWKFN